MTSIKIILSDERKKKLKKAAIDQSQTLSQYILERVDPNGGNDIQTELKAISERLERYGGQLSKDEREALKNRRNELRKAVECSG